MLPRGTVLRDGDHLRGDGRRWSSRCARPPRACRWRRTDDPHLLARAAYHLGNRHVPLQIGAGLSSPTSTTTCSTTWCAGWGSTVATRRRALRARRRARSSTTQRQRARLTRHDHGHDARPRTTARRPRSAIALMPSSMPLPPLTGLPLLRLLQLASPALPIGAFAYSQGLEAAVAAGWVARRGQRARLDRGLLEHALASLDLPVLARLHAAWAARRSRPRVTRWNALPRARRAPPPSCAPRIASSAPRWRACSTAWASPRRARAGSRQRRRHLRGDVRARGRARWEIPLADARCTASPSPGPRRRSAPPCAWCRSARAPASASCSSSARASPPSSTRALALADDETRRRRARARASPARTTRPSTLGCFDLTRSRRNHPGACMTAHATPRTAPATEPHPLRLGVAGPVGSGKTALVDALCKRLRDQYRHRRRHQRHLHQGGRAVPDPQRRAARGAHRRRRDRRLPAHRHPRGRVDQPRRPSTS